jgi:hypothetical protein
MSNLSWLSSYGQSTFEPHTKEVNIGCLIEAGIWC